MPAATSGGLLCQVLLKKVYGVPYFLLSEPQHALEEVFDGSDVLPQDIEQAARVAAQAPEEADALLW